MSRELDPGILYMLVGGPGAGQWVPYTGDEYHYPTQVTTLPAFVPEVAPTQPTQVHYEIYTMNVLSTRDSRDGFCAFYAPSHMDMVDCVSELMQNYNPIEGES